MYILKNNFIRVGIASSKILLNNPEKNLEKILEIINQAVSSNVKVLLFPELNICGGTCGDIFWSDNIFQQSQKVLAKLKIATENFDLLCMVGLPLAYNNLAYNVVAVLQQGKILGIVPKSYLTNSEKRYFVSGARTNNITVDLLLEDIPFGVDLVFACENFPALKLGLEIGEDFFAAIPPSSELVINSGASLICNPSLAPNFMGKDNTVKNLLQAHSQRLKTAYMYSAAGDGESTTDMIFTGKKYIYETGELIVTGDKNSKLLCADLDFGKIINARRKNTSNNSMVTSKAYREIKFTLHDTNYLDVERYLDQRPFIPNELSLAKYSAEVFSLQVAGLQHRMEVIGCKNLIIGVSGGLDSTLALIVAKEVAHNIGGQVIAVTMPCFGTSKRTFDNSIRLLNTLKLDYKIIDISTVVEEQLQLIEEPKGKSLTVENSQARQRTMILMNLANQYQGIVVGTADLSEIALGFCTYNGDHMSMYNVNGSVFKTMIADILFWYADEKNNDVLNTICHDIVDTPISPELIPLNEIIELSQQTEDIVGNYKIIDYILYYHIKYNFVKEKIAATIFKAFANEFSEQEINKALDNYFSRFYKNQFKRSCMPDGVQVTEFSLSPRGGLILPSDL